MQSSTSGNCKMIWKLQSWRVLKPLCSSACSTRLCGTKAAMHTMEVSSVTTKEAWATWLSFVSPAVSRTCAHKRIFQATMPGKAEHVISAGLRAVPVGASGPRLKALLCEAVSMSERLWLSSGEHLRIRNSLTQAPDMKPLRDQVLQGNDAKVGFELSFVVPSRARGGLPAS